MDRHERFLVTFAVEASLTEVDRCALTQRLVDAFPGVAVIPLGAIDLEMTPDVVQLTDSRLARLRRLPPIVHTSQRPALRTVCGDGVHLFRGSNLCVCRATTWMEKP